MSQKQEQSSSRLLGEVCGVCGRELGDDPQTCEVCHLYICDECASSHECE